MSLRYVRMCRLGTGSADAHSFGFFARVELENGVCSEQSEVLAAGAPEVVLLAAAARVSLGLFDPVTVAPVGMQAPVVGVQGHVLRLGLPARLALLLLLLSKPGPMGDLRVKLIR